LQHAIDLRVMDKILLIGREVVTVKDLKYESKCVEKILNKHSCIDVVVYLSNFIFDVFAESLKNEKPDITDEEIFREWKKIMSLK